MHQTSKVVMASIVTIIILIISSLFNGCSSCYRSTTSASSNVPTAKLKYDAVFPADPHTTFVVDKDIDLNGKTLLMPEGVTLTHKKGLIKNGTLIGNNTQIKSNQALFNVVHIKGTWNVPEVSTALFADLNYENALRDVLALTSSNVTNNVLIEEGHYLFTPEKSGAEYVCITSNTNLTLNGTIEIAPNPFKTYHIVSIEGTNIKVSGTGCIIGDKLKHQGTEGEWGMGLYISNTSKCEVLGLTVKDCWGDCVYVGKGSTNITLSGLTLINGRRQGISITDGENIRVINTTITGVFGTAPAYAIDVEPNKQNHIRNVTIENVIAKDCEGGFVVSVVYPEESSVDGVVFNKCRIEGVQKKYALRLNNCKNVLVKRSFIGTCNYNYNCNFTKVEGIKLTDNEIHTKDVVVNDISSVTLSGNDVYGNGLYPISIKNFQPSKKQRIKNNRIHK